MRKLLFVLFLIGIFLVGCSSQTLQDAINNSAYGKHDNPEILYRNDEKGIVLILTKDAEGNFIIYRSNFEKNHFERYDLNTNGDNSIPVDIGKKSEFITIDVIEEDGDNSIHLVWGGIFHYPSAKQVVYTIHNADGALLYQNKVEISKKHIFVDVLQNSFNDSHSISYDVIDQEGNVLYSQK